MPADWRIRAVACVLLAALDALHTSGAIAAASLEPTSGAPRQQFVPPAPGTYALPPIQQVPQGRVVDIDGRERAFWRYTTGRVTLLSFMYTYCVDPVGCPLAFATLNTVRERLLSRADLARRVQLVSLSFDPGNDDPQTMRRYAGDLAAHNSAVRWHFLTTRSVEALKPLLDGLGQDVSVELDDRGKPTRVLSHMMKVFLIDASGRVREIYSTAFLLPEVLLNDIETLLLE